MKEEKINSVELCGLAGEIIESKLLENMEPEITWLIYTDELQHLENAPPSTQRMKHVVKARAKMATFIQKYMEVGQKVSVQGKVITHELREQDSIVSYRIEILIDDVLILTDA